MPHVVAKAVGGASAALFVALAASTLVALPAIAGAEDAKKVEPAKPATPWRHDPSVKRRPGSYIGGGIGYSRPWAWIPANDQHGDLAPGPFNGYGMTFGVGDAFAEWFALGFRIQIASGKNGGSQYGSFGLMLDTTFYPWRGLGLRPSFGLGFGYATGEHDWETGGGGPGCLAFGVLYEFRLGRLLSLAPVVQVSWTTGEGFDAVVFFAGLEITKWFRTATG
jgi:hypothetical protein